MKNNSKKFYIYKWVGGKLKIKSCSEKTAIKTANRLRKLINMIDAVRK